MHFKSTMLAVATQQTKTDHRRERLVNEFNDAFDGLKGHTVAEVAEVLGLSKRTIYREIDEGSLRCLRFGKAIRITDSQLEEFLKAREG